MKRVQPWIRTAARAQVSLRGTLKLTPLNLRTCEPMRTISFFSKSLQFCMFSFYSATNKKCKKHRKQKKGKGKQDKKNAAATVSTCHCYICGHFCHWQCRRSCRYPNCRRQREQGVAARDVKGGKAKFETGVSSLPSPSAYNFVSFILQRCGQEA
jgi:hypothetical protein